VVAPLPASVHESVAVPVLLIVLAVTVSVGVAGAPVQSRTVIAPPEPVTVVYPQALVAFTLMLFALYAPAVAPVTVIDRVVEEPVSPVGNVHA
jgi:hypothetical protein